ncbi:hypothetical protein BJF84_10315 [Rhodococcus sp. CUA-806]|nr:hypothetical protein BJF84_10315 [Rhodococcus sp. CUA-806]
MPIYVHLDVDINSCRTCAAALDELSTVAESSADKFKQARDKSEYVWDSPTGNDFRDTITTLAKAAEQTSDHASALAAALRVFTDSMLTAKEHLNRAATLAASAGLWVGPNSCDATWIGDPEPLPLTGPWTIEQRTKQATQVSAYNDALEMVDDARAIEAGAHSTLAAAFADSESWLDRLRNSAPWMIAGGAISYLGTAAQQADQWGSVAQTRAAQVGRLTDIAGEALPDSVRTSAARASTVFSTAADDAARYAAQNSALVPGQFTKKIGGLVSEGLPFGGKVGSKVPVAGVYFTGAQILYDLQGAEDAGDMAKVVAKDAGGFLAGTAATALLAGSVAGGPATVAAVGVGILFAYGVGELIELAVD